MEAVIESANAIRKIFSSPNAEFVAPKSPDHFEQSSPFQSERRSTMYSQQQSPGRSCNNTDMDDLDGKPMHELKKIVINNRRKVRQVCRSHQQLHQENQYLLQKLQEMEQVHDELRRARHEVWRENRELRQEQQDLHQVQRQQRESTRNYRELQQAHQTLHEKSQELQCEYDEMAQLLIGVENVNQKLKSDLKQANSHIRKDKQTSDEDDDLNYWKSRYEYLLQQIILPYANKSKLEYHDVDGTSMDLVLNPLQHDISRGKSVQKELRDSQARLQGSQLEAQSLRNQVRELQKVMLAQVQTVQAVPDEHFTRDFRAIIAHVKALSRSVRPSSGSDIVQALDSGLLLLNTSERHRRTRQNQKYCIEAWIWSVLLEHVFATPFAIFGSASSAISHNWVWLYGRHHEGKQPSPSASCETYRRNMFEEFVRLAGRDTILSGQEEAYTSGRVVARKLAEGALGCRGQVATTIGTQLATISSTVDVSQISSIVNRSFALALEMSSQRCRLQVTYPAIGATFHSSSMLSMPDLDGEDVNDGDVALIINPGLTKWGDAHGKNLNQRYDLVPSLVQLQPPKPCASGQDYQERKVT